MNRQLIGILVFCTLHLCIFSQSSITFSVEDVPEGEKLKVGVRGSISPLSWEKSIPLRKTGDEYSVTLDFENYEKDLEFKFVLFSNDENPVWENIQNRTLSVKEDQVLSSDNFWNKEQVMDISSLPLISSELLLEDYRLIEKMVLDVHPGTYRYNTKEEIAEALRELKSKFSESVTLQEAYLAISKLTAHLKCDHTKAGFNNQNKLVNSMIHYQKDKMPFTFKWIEGEMIVLCNASDSEFLKRGTRIISINGIPVLNIRDRMQSYIGADGDTDQNRNYKTEVNGYDFRYNAFDIFYPLLYSIEQNKIELEIQEINSNRIDTVIVAALTRQDRFLNLSERYPEFPKSRDDMWKFDMLTDNVALLELNSFGLNGWKALSLDYKTFLSDAFNELREGGVQNLIIDIRENTGGSDEIANELYKYISASSLSFEREGRTRYLSFPDLLKPYIRTWGDEPWYYNLDPPDRTKVDGYYIFKDNFQQADKKSDKMIFMGKIFLLSSAANTSLAFYTAARFRLHDLGLIIGQETGGNLNDVNGGQILFLNLPNSQIEIDFPVMGGFSTQKQANMGVSPDIITKYSRKDIVENKDIEIEKVLEIINGMK